MLGCKTGDLVQVRLTPKGVSILNKFSDSKAKQLIADCRPEFREEREREIAEVANSEKAIPADGWKQFQLWELMRIFGQHIHAVGEQPFINNRIRFLRRTA